MLKSPSLLNKLVTLVIFVAAFLVMASVFSPERTKAGDVQRGGVNDPSSSDPHAGLESLGTLDSAEYTAHIYATPQGPRYTIYTKADGREVATLLTAEQAT